MNHLLDYPFETQPTKMSCGPASIANLLGYFGKEVNTDTIIKKFPLINHIGMIPSQYESTLIRELQTLDLSVQKKQITLEDIEEKISKGIPVPCLILEQSLSNPHGNKDNMDHNFHYVTVIGIDKDNITIANPFYNTQEVLPKQTFIEKRGLTSDKISTKANIFKTLGNLKSNTAFDINIKKGGLKFPDFMYLHHDRKENVIDTSIKEGKLGIGATTHETREELFKNLIESEKKDITITMGTGGFFSRYDLQEIKSIEERISGTDKNITEVFGGSGGSLAVILWALGKYDKDSLNHMCNVPTDMMQDWKTVASNASYITAAKMMPYITKISITDQVGKPIEYNTTILEELLISKFDEFFKEIMMYQAGGSLEITGGFIPEHIIKNIYQKIITQAYKEDNKVLGDINIEDINYSIKKLTYNDIYNQTGKNIGTLIAAKNKGESYKSIKINKDNDITVLDGLMASSHLGKKPLQLQIGEKLLHLKDPYFTTKTTAEKHIHDMIADDSYHLALVTLNRFRLNPTDTFVKLGIRNNTKEKRYADGVLAPDFKKINSLNPQYIPDIDFEIDKFTGKKTTYNIFNIIKDTKKI